MELVEGQADSEAGRTGLGSDTHVSAVLADDAHGVVESESETLAGGLRGEEGLEDVRLGRGIHAVAGIRYGELDMGAGFMISDILQVDGTFIKSFDNGIRNNQKRFSMLLKF